MNEALELARSINCNAPIAVQTGMQTLRSHKVYLCSFDLSLISLSHCVSRSLKDWMMAC
jgi:hypothetical protein